MNALKVFMEALNVDFEINNHYNSDFVAKIEKSRQKIAEGKGVIITIQELWK